MDATRFEIHPQLAQTSYPLVSLPYSDLRLVDDARFPWVLVIPRISNAVELIDLPPEIRTPVGVEIDHVCRILRDVFAPYKLNVAALGNQVRQLHVHVIARYVDDPAWPNPVWGMGQSMPYDEDGLASRLRLLSAALQ